MGCDSPRILRLELGANTLDFMDPGNGFYIDTLDLGYPAVRDDTSATPDRDGEWDDTWLFGARVVSVGGSITPGPAIGSRSAVLDTLAPFLVASARPRLVFSVDDLAPRFVTLRPSQLSAPFTHPSVSAFTVAWSAPDPVCYSLDGRSLIIASSSAVFGRRYTDPQTTGIVTPMSAWIPPRVYPSMRGVQAAQAINAGTMNTPPVFQIFGPCTNPAVYNDTLGAMFAVGTDTAPLTLGATDVLTLDYRNRAVYVGTDPNNGGRYAYVDFGRSSWWPLVPGPNALRFVPVTAQAGAQAVCTWNDAYL
jgi:Siphovirus-type tail component, C-terminal domain